MLLFQHASLTEMIGTLEPILIEYGERQKRIHNSLEEDLSRNTTLSFEARKVSWLWKLVPLGVIPATFVIQSKVGSCYGSISAPDSDFVIFFPPTF